MRGKISNSFQVDKQLTFNLSTKEVTGPLIVDLIPKYYILLQPRWRKQFKYHKGKKKKGSRRFWVRLLSLLLFLLTEWQINSLKIRPKNSLKVPVYLNLRRWNLKNGKRKLFFEKISDADSNPTPLAYHRTALSTSPHGDI